MSALVLAALVGPVALGAQGTNKTITERADSATKVKAVEIIGTVTGTGRTRAVNAINRDAITQVPLGTNALRLVEQLPGVNVQSSDPNGSYEWSNRVTIRGFQTSQIGQTFDGITLGDMSYGNFNGLGMGRAVDSDNLAGASVAQGSGALGTSSSNNLGGVIQYLSDDPTNDGRWRLTQLVGAAATRRTGLRWDSGLHLLGSEGGFKAYVSFSRSDNDKYKGSGARYSGADDGLLGQKGFLFGTGQTWQDQVNIKAQYFSGSSKYTFFWDFAQRKEADYVDFSMARFQQSGRDWDQYSSWGTAVTAAGSATPDEAYFNSSQGARKDNIGYLLAEYDLGGARLSIQPYLHADDGAGDWHAPTYGSTAFTTDPIYFRQSQYEATRYGANVKLAGEVAGNALEGGLWTERNTTTNRRIGWRLKNYLTGPEVDFNNVLRLFYDRTGTLTNTVAWVQNTNKFLDDRLRLTYGVKYLHIGADFVNNGKTRVAATYGDTARPNASFDTDGGILPQAGAVFALNGSDEVFANFSQNVNALPYSPAGGVYNTNPAAFAYFNANTKPEKATTFEAGVRTRRGPVDASLSLYTINYENRLIGVAVCPLTATCLSSFANVGSVGTKGAEALVRWKVMDGLTWQTAFAYNESKINENYTSGTTVIPSKDKWVVDAPLVQAQSNVRYDNNGFFATGAVRFASARFFSILNDYKTGAYGQVDAGLGYRLGKVANIKDLSVQLNVINLTDRAQIATVGTGGFTVSGDNQTLQSAPPRLIYLSLSAAF
jgi:iron complex outermembrane receptor protein